MWSLTLHLNLSHMNSWDVWTPGPKLSYMNYLRFKSYVVILNDMRWSTSFKSFSQMMMMNIWLRSIWVHTWLFEKLNLKKISMRGNYFSRTLWKLSFTYGIQILFKPHNPCTLVYLFCVHRVVCVFICDVWNSHWISE